jgi:deoxyadenosine/deoxycytidine kinase
MNTILSVQDESATPTPMQVLVVAVFGAPATGKTTLLRKLAKYTEGKIHYVTIDEPTNDPVINDLIAKMYKERTGVVPEGQSVAWQVQTRIAQMRIETYDDFAHMHLAGHIEDAARKGCDTIALVSEGHLLTDDKLYVQSKVDSGQITKQQFHYYEVAKADFLSRIPRLYAQPCAFLELALDDTSGVTHVARIEARGSKAESGEPPEVFANLARYSEQTRRILEKPNNTFLKQPVVDRIVTDRLSPEDLLRDFCAFVSKLAADARAESRALLQRSSAAPKSPMQTEILGSVS